jgi:hypothetical protein
MATLIENGEKILHQLETFSSKIHFNFVSNFSAEMKKMWRHSLPKKILLMSLFYYTLECKEILGKDF